jgi:hypothetical protein
VATRFSVRFFSYIEMKVEEGGRGADLYGCRFQFLGKINSTTTTQESVFIFVFILHAFPSHLDPPFSRCTMLLCVFLLAEEEGLN